jgi:hypothetical protein
MWGELMPERGLGFLSCSLGLLASRLNFFYYVPLILSRLCLGQDWESNPWPCTCLGHDPSPPCLLKDFHGNHVGYKSG